MRTVPVKYSAAPLLEACEPLVVAQYEFKVSKYPVASRLGVRHGTGMPRRASKREDTNQTAARVVAISTGQPPPKIPRKNTDKKKNPAAVALGKLGGSKGGKIRAERLSAERRSDIAKKAAAARWRSE